MIYQQTDSGVLYCGDCLDVMKQLADNSVDSIVTDPPYELGFMGKSWDNTGIAYNVDMWKECLRVLKPGGHLLSFGGSRTYHRMACAIEDAGFEVRDMIEWMYGSGFPKSLNLGNGYGTALKPAHEPVCMARKPISEKTIAENVLRWGTGGINVDGCMVGINEVIAFGKTKDKVPDANCYGKYNLRVGDNQNPQGRFPANLIHDGSDEVLECFPETKSGLMKQHIEGGNFNVYGKQYPRYVETIGDSGSAARFFANFPLDRICPLCNVSWCKDSNKEENKWKSTLALSAEKNGWTTPAITEFIARLSAVPNQDARSDQSVGFAEILCKKCKTLIALAIAGIKNSAFSKEELQVILGCIGNFNECILTQSLACYAEMQGNTDTTQIMTSLLKLSGFVNHVTTNSTPETERSEQRSCVYSPKASKAERNAGCDGVEPKRDADRTKDDGSGGDNPRNRSNTPKQNYHPTVKPKALMQYLCRLITPKGGTVLDPFTGSGTTLCSAIREGFEYIGIEMQTEYCEIAAKRIESELAQGVIEL